MKKYKLITGITVLILSGVIAYLISLYSGKRQSFYEIYLIYRVSLSTIILTFLYFIVTALMKKYRMLFLIMTVILNTAFGFYLYKIHS
jgi:hypothetical protein